MTHDRMAPLMGLAMGAMIPPMLHGLWAGAGLAFVVAHVVAGLILLALTLVLPTARTWVAAHVPSRRSLARMGLALPLGAALICLHCLFTWHGTV